MLIEGERVSGRGHRLLTDFGVRMGPTRRQLVSYCRDWHGQRSHVGRALGAGLFERFRELDWLRPQTGTPRGLVVTALGRRGFRTAFGVDAGGLAEAGPVRRTATAGTNLRGRMIVAARPGLTITAIGDVFLDRDEPETAFDHVRDLFGQADVAFANLEGGYADEWERAPSAGVPLVAAPKFVEHIAGAGLTVLSLANNHSVDGGYRTLMNTRQLLHDHGLATAGAGKDTTEAHHPAIRSTVRGTVAVLGYAAVFPHGDEARPGWPGLAPLRGYTHYTQWEENEWNPGLLPRVSTTPHEGDLAALRADIAAAREQADTGSSRCGIMAITDQPRRGRRPGGGISPRVSGVGHEYRSAA